MDKDMSIAEAKALRQADELEDSQDLLLDLLEAYPDDPVVLFEVGGSYDVFGEEEEAIPYYQKAIEAGLDGSDLQECLICLSTNYRVIGEYQEAVDTLENAVKRFPESNSIKAFLTLAYYSNDQYDAAVSLLLNLLLTTTKDDDILSFADTLDFYKDNLDDIGSDE